MGTRYTFECNKCNYKLESSGKPSSAMLYVVSPYLCIDCKIITDVAVGIYGDSYSKEFIDNLKRHLLPSFIKDHKDDFYKCEECNGENLESWDSEKGDCPKCDGNLSIDKDAPIMCWD